MSDAEALVAFAASLAVLLAAAGGVAGAAARQDLLDLGGSRREPLVIGFLLLAVAAAMHGVRHEAGATSPAVLVPGVVGLLLLGWALAGPRLAGAPMWLLRAGVLLLVLAGIADVLAATGTGGDALRFVGAVLLAAGLLLASRRSLGMRMAAAAAAIGLGVGLAGSLALAAVVVDRVGDDAVRDDVLHALFAIAVTAAAAAIALGTMLGAGFGRTVRRLTDAARAVQAGDLDVDLSGLPPGDLELLAGTFGRMVESLRRMTDELREAVRDEARLRARLEAVLAGMGDALVAVDTEGRVVEFNPAAERLFGRPAGEVRGRPVADLHLLTPEGEDLAARLCHPADGPWTSEAAVTARGGVVPVLVGAAPLHGSAGEAAGGVALVRDLSAEAQVERTKTELLSNISHEMRTPLTPIKGYAHMLAEREVPPERVREFASEIALASAQLERVIDQLLNFATMTAGRLTPTPAPVPAGDLVAALERRWADLLDRRHHLAVSVAPDVPPLLVDARLVGIALDELVDNAVKYSPEGGPIDVTVAAGEPGTAVVSVRDRGIGIDAGRLPALLREFSQADASPTRRFGGLGIGLPMVGHVARSHGGDVRVQSGPGEGATFSLVLPVAG